MYNQMKTEVDIKTSSPLSDENIEYAKYIVQKKTLKAAGWVLADMQNICSSERSFSESELVKHSRVYGFAHPQTGQVWTTTVVCTVENYTVDYDSGERTMEYRRSVEDRPDLHAWKELFAELSSK